MNDIEKAMQILIDSKKSLASCINVFLDNHMFGYGFDKKDRYNEAQELSELYYKMKGE